MIRLLENAKIYIAGHRGLVGSAILHNLQAKREYLLREGFPADRVIKTGSPLYEVLHHYLPKIEGSRVREAPGPRGWSPITACPTCPRRSCGSS